MKELVLFYSYTGNAKKAAQKFSQDNNCALCEVLDEKRPNKFAAYTAGCFKAMRGGERKIKPLMLNGSAVKFEDYGIINIFAPIWASNPAPPINSALKLIPKKTKVKLFMVSASGKSGKDAISKRVQDMGLEIAGYEDIKM